MKRFLLTLLSIIMITACVPFAAFAADPVLISGENAMLSSGDADALEINGVKFTKTDDIAFTATITVSDCTSDYSFIYLNDKQIAKLVDGENVIELKTSMLKDGENELKVMLGAGNATYNDSVVYGTVNADDIVVESVSFNGADLTLPAKVNQYMPIEGEAGTTLKTVDYKTGISVGDGWFSDTKLGGNTPNNPVYVGYLFNKPESNGVFVVDTTKLNDGENVAVFYKDGKIIDEQKIVVDNTAPVVTFSVANGAKLSKLDNVTYTVTDTTAYKTELYLDGKRARTIKAKNLSVGSHTAYVVATDELGHSTIEMLLFEVTDELYKVIITDEDVTVRVLGDATLYTGTILKDVHMFENRLGELELDHLRYEDEVLVSFDDKADLVTTAIGDKVPYQSFVVNTEYADSDSVVVSYTGETGNGVDIKLIAWNYVENRWDNIAKTESGKSVSVSLDLETYSHKKKMRINAVPDMVYNGSNTILWNSDTQYYSRFEDLNEFYYRINQYAVEQYNAGNIGYCVHTGDLIDQSNVGDETAHKEYGVASKAQDILDKANVPNGVVSGNHDIKHDTADYNYYYKYFGEDRYNDFDWYGGSLNNNMHHYDLVSIGLYDFVFLYIGNYMEDKEDTIAWANAVCEAYPERNVVICTHEYILPSGEYSGERAEVIWDEIVVPNENVVMILCGHNEGVCDQLHQVGDSDRYVLEILADYQFAELGVGPQHVVNNCTCDGEGYVRLMTFNEAGQLVSTTFSPVASDYDVNPYNFYPSYSDSFIYDLDLIKAERSISTSEFNVVCNPKEIGDVGVDDMDLIGIESFYAKINYNGETSYSKIYVLKEYENNYSVDDPKEYEEPVYEKVYSSGLANVSENFRMGEDNAFPDSTLVEVGLNLLPESDKTLYQTSGSKTYSTSVADNGGITMYHENNGANWVTLGNKINKRLNVDEYNRVYFAVSADKNAKWNIYVNFATYELNFSQNKKVAKLFGYVNSAPSDIRGTWCGYIDLSEFVTGEQTISSIYIVSATPGATVTFDYLFLGKSNGGKIRFVTDETISTAFEGKIGSEMDVLASPYKYGYTFDGWYTESEGGEKVEGSIKFDEEVTSLYARFTPKTTNTKEIVYYDNEINLERVSVVKIVIICSSILIMLVVVLVLRAKMNKSTKKQKRQEH